MRQIAVSFLLRLNPDNIRTLFYIFIKMFGILLFSPIISAIIILAD